MIGIRHLTLDTQEYLMKQNEKIEDEIQRRYPNSPFISFNGLMCLDSVIELHYMATCVGISIVHFNGEIMDTDKVIRFNVPSESELFFTTGEISNRDMEPLEHRMQGKELAKLVKTELLYIFTHFCIRCYDSTKELPFNLRFQFNEHNTKITESSFLQLKDKYEYIKLHEMNKTRYNNLDENAKPIFSVLIHQLSTLYWYGILISVDGIDIQNGSVAELQNYIDSGKPARLSLSVPEFSEFSIGNGKEGEISGDNAYNFAIETLKKVGIITEFNSPEINYIVRTGEKWTKKDQDAAIKLTNMVEESYKE